MRGSPEPLDWKIMLIAILVVSLLIPYGAGAAEQMVSEPSFSNRSESETTGPERFVIPPQEEGKLPVPSSGSKPWYRTWWVWAIVSAVAAGVVISLSAHHSDRHPEPVIQ